MTVAQPRARGQIAAVGKNLGRRAHRHRARLHHVRLLQFALTQHEHRAANDEQDNQQAGETPGREFEQGCDLHESGRPLS